MDAVGAQFYDEKHIQGLEIDRFHAKEVADQDLFFVVRHQVAPTDGSVSRGAGYRQPVDNRGLSVKSYPALREELA